MHKEPQYCNMALLTKYGDFYQESFEVSMAMTFLKPKNIFISWIISVGVKQATNCILLLLLSDYNSSNRKSVPNKVKKTRTS